MLKIKGGKIIVARVRIGTETEAMSRIYDAWVNGVRIYEAEKHFRVGQVVKVPADFPNPLDDQADPA